MKGRCSWITPETAPVHILFTRVQVSGVRNAGADGVPGMERGGRGAGELKYLTKDWKRTAGNSLSQRSRTTRDTCEEV